MSTVTELPVAAAGFTLERLLRLFELGREAFWRHDVDFDLSCAAEMAELEARNGIASTFYLRVDEQEYSLADAGETAAFVYALGHRVGVHTDLTLPRDANVPSGSLARCAATDLSKLRGVFPAAEATVSLHAPPRGALWRHIDRLEHAMAPEWEGRYVADSRGVFRSSPEAMMLNDPTAQIGAHPEWWFLPPSEAARLRRQEASKP